MTRPTPGGERGSTVAPPAASLLRIPIYRSAETTAAPASGPPATSHPATESEPAARGAASAADPHGEAQGRQSQPRNGTPPRNATSAPPDLGRYWRRLGKGGPALVEDLDPGLIAARWPYTLLIRVPEDGLLDVVQVFANGAGAANGRGGAPAEDEGGHPFADDRCSQISTWVLRLARHVAQDLAPRETTEAFPVGPGLRRFAARALPCRSRSDRAPYVLVNVTQAEEAGHAGRV